MENGKLANELATAPRIEFDFDALLTDLLGHADALRMTKELLDVRIKALDAQLEPFTRERIKVQHALGFLEKALDATRSAKTGESEMFEED